MQAAPIFPFTLNDTNAHVRNAENVSHRPRYPACPSDRVPLNRERRKKKRGVGGRGKEGKEEGKEERKEGKRRGDKQPPPEKCPWPRTHSADRSGTETAQRRHVETRWYREGREGTRGTVNHAVEQKGGKGRNIPMQRAPWHRYCISGTLQSPLPKPVDYLPDIHRGYLPNHLSHSPPPPKYITSPRSRTKEPR